MNELITEKLLQSGNDKYLVNNIREFLGENCCDKCHTSVKYPLTNVMSFNQNKGTYDFKDLPGANYVLKKFCKNCCRCKASTAPIYIEIDN